MTKKAPLFNHHSTVGANVAATVLALPIANAWTITACGNEFSGTGTSSCTSVSCAAGQVIDFDAGSTGGAIELSLFSDAVCRNEITHFASNESDYVLPQDLRSFLVLT
ncbi:hypothetical protein BJX76DRAFT_357652 [Aspergillus varians]